MALILVATPGAANANAYADVAEATAYANYRVGGAAFTALSSDQKIQALVTAAGDIDTLGEAGPASTEVQYRFIGERATDTQSMEWPRDDGDLPANLVRANIELAMSYAPAFATGYTGDVLNQNRTDGSVKRKKIDVIETEWFAARTTDATALERFPDVVQRLLASLLVAITSGWGGSATVSRGS